MNSFGRSGLPPGAAIQLGPLPPNGQKGCRHFVLHVELSLLRPRVQVDADDKGPAEVFVTTPSS